MLLGGAVGVAVLGVGLLLGTDAGNRVVLGQVLPLVQPPSGSITVEALHTTLGGHVGVDGLSIRDSAGRELYGADTVALDLRLGALVGRRVVIDHARVSGLRVGLTEGETCLDPAAPWADPTAAPTPSAPWTGIGVDLDLADVEIAATEVRFCGGLPLRVSPVTLTGAASLHGPRVSADVRLAGDVADPAWGPLTAALAGSWDGREALVDHLDVSLGGPGGDHLAAHGALRDLTGEGSLALTVDSASVDPARYGAPQVHGPITLTGDLTGTLAAPAAGLVLGTPGGAAVVSAGLDLHDERPRWTVTVDTTGLALDKVVADVPATTLAGRYQAVGAGFGWPDDLDATVTVDAVLPVAGGQPGPFQAKGTATLHAGTVALTGLDLTGAGARLTADGVVRVTGEDGEVYLRGADLELSELARYGAPGLSGHARYAGKVRFGWGEAPAAEVDGQLVVSRFGYGADVHAASVTGPVRAGYGPDGAWLDGSLAATSLVAPGVQVGSADVVPRLALSPEGRPRGEVTLRAGPVSAAPYAFDTVAGRVAIDGDAVTADLHADRAGAERVALRGGFDLRRLAFDVAELRVAADGTTWTNDGPLRGRVVDGGITDLAVVLRGGEARVEATGSYTPRGPADLHVGVTALSFPAIAALYPGVVDGWAGVIDATGDVRGTGEAPTVHVDAALRGFTLPGEAGKPPTVTGLDATLAVDSDPAGLRVAGAAAGPEGAVAKISGTVPVFLDERRRGLDRAAPLDVHVLVPPGDERRFEALLPGQDLPTLRASAEVRVGGTLDAPTAGVTASVASPAGPRAPWLVTDVDGDVRDGTLTLRTIVREKLVRRAQATGTVGLDLARLSRALLDGGDDAALGGVALLGDLSLDIVPLQLPIEALASGGVAGVTGNLLGGLHLSGPAMAPQVQGAVLILGGRVGRVDLSSGQLTIAPRAGVGYVVDLTVGMGELGGAHVWGLVPWTARLDGDLDAALDRPGLLLSVDASGIAPGGARLGLPLAALEGVVPGLEAGDGRLEVSGNITGSLRAPAPELEMWIHGGEVALRDTGVRYKDIQLRGSVDADAIRVTQLTLATTPLVPSPGRLDLEVGRRADEHDIDATASVALAGWAPTTIRGGVKLSRARLLELPTRRVQVSGDVELTGEWPQVRLGGDVHVDSGYVELSENFFLQTSDLGLDPGIVVRRAGQEEVAAAGDGGLPMPDLALGVSLDRAVDVDVTMPTEQTLGDIGATYTNLRVQATLDGDVTLGATGGALDIAGQVQPVRGTATVLGKPFDIQTGGVSFTGSAWDDPFLQLAAEYRSSQYGTIRADIGGSASAPTIRLTGEEGLSADDAVQILLFGAPLSDTGGAGGADALVGMLLSGLGKEIAQARRATALDLVELGLGGSTRVGKRIGRRVLIVLELDPSPDDGQSPLRVTGEIQLPKRWFMVIEYGSLGDTQVSAVRRWRF